MDLGPLAEISPGDSDNSELPVSRLSTANWIYVLVRFLQPVQLRMLEKEVTTLAGSKCLIWLVIVPPIGINAATAEYRAIRVGPWKNY